jgi:hypothetical protein
VWCVLEEYDLASPTTTVELKNGLIDMRFTFASPEDCAAAMVALEEFVLTVEPDEGRDDEVDGIGKELRERVARETAIFTDAVWSRN